MKLAKDCIDVGVRTNKLEAILKFWTQKVELPYEKVSPAGYRELLTSSDVSKPTQLVDPNGNKVTLVPVGMHGITNIGMLMVVRSLDDARRFFTSGVQATPLSDTTFRRGTAAFLLEEDKDILMGRRMQGPGYRYMTVTCLK